MWSLRRVLFVLARAVIMLTSVVLEALLLLYAVHYMLGSRASPSTAAPVTVPMVLTRSVYPEGFVRAHPELCPNNGTGVKLVILVASATNNTSMRRAIRRSWGRAARRAGVVVAFVLGVPPAGIRTDIQWEDARKRDIIQGKYTDTYSNLTLKSVSMLKWFSAYCWRAARLLKLDDDMYANVPAVLRFVARHRANNTIWGAVSEAEALLHPSDKYFAVEPGRFPAFAAGAYLVAGDAARRLARAAGAAPLLRLEDVFVTGVAARRAHARLRHAPWFLRPWARGAGCDAAHWLVVHLRLARDHGTLHRLISNKRYGCRASPPY